MDHYGIDFGTRNTAVECSSGKLTTARGTTIPSAVAYHLLSDEMRFGDDALQLLLDPNDAVRDRWRVATSFKTALGSDAPFVKTSKGSKSAQGVLEDYFRFLVRHAEVQGLPPLSSAAFSIPVDFGAASRSRMLLAARAAGISPVVVVAESTAAYLNVAASQGRAERVAVVDWGAGTLDISVLGILGGSALGFQVDERACRGSNIAGDRIDLSIYEFFAREARSTGRTIPTADQVPPEIMRPILRRCELEKISLSDHTSNRQSVKAIFQRFVDGKGAEFTLTSQDLRELGKQACVKAFGVLTEAIAEAGLTLRQLDQIIFVGGCTRLLGFREEAEELFGLAAMFPSEPEWVVAAGALQVAEGGACYECLQEFGCVLDDGGFLPLSHRWEFVGGSTTITVAATERTKHASLIFADREADRVSMVGSLSVPLQGHVGEPVHVRTTLKRDLTVGIEAWTSCGIEPKDVRRLDVTNTRFRFKVNP